ncbi:phage holin family protein [Novosphingobium sp. PC22D]|uniref:phage holin family protein n=1 Tax=Novosphingobium sp. PC22D TaxID=1962403 RepID=UPI001F0B703D|nr:phage holin family protein [Novosphingobium sp. PC22D]
MALAAPDPDARERSLQDDLKKLAEEARTAAEAEFAFQKSRAAYAGKAAPRIIGLLVVAAVFVFFAIMAFVVGTIIALGPLLTAWGAMAAVTLALLVIALVLALTARSIWKTVLKVIADDRSSS